MAEPAQVLEDIFTVIEGGKDLGEAGKIIQFPSDNGQKVYQAVEMTQQGSNGTGLRYWAAAIASAGSRALSSGAIMLGMEVGVVGAAIAPALGLVSGYVLYNLAPEFWDGVANALIEAGETVKGKVVAYMNENGILTFSEETIEIFKNKFLEAGVFNGIREWDEDEPQDFPDDKVYAPLILSSAYKYTAPTGVVGETCELYYAGLTKQTNGGNIISRVGVNFANPIDDIKITSFEYPYSTPSGNVPKLGVIVCTKNSNPGSCRIQKNEVNTLGYVGGGTGYAQSFTYDNRTVYYVYWTFPFTEDYYEGTGTNTLNYQHPEYVAWMMQYGNFNTSGDGIQEGAELPDEDPFTVTYPDWLPHDFPVVEGQTIIKRYPLEYPDSLPREEPYQGEAQNPDIGTAPEPAIETISDPANNPDEEINPEDEEVIDPEPQPDPDPIPVPESETIPDPIEPDPPGPITPVIPVPSMPSTISSNKLFTVYNPSASQLDQLGGYLWDSNLIEVLKKIWQNPLDGIISLTQVFVTPPTNGSHNIILGYLDSQVSAPVVSNQFVTVDCGTIDVDEISNNCLDYVPYTQLQLYLPFIGITEIDTNEFMEGSINVKYHVDVYTGSCLAEVKCTRSRDLANGTILYTFNGNCSQQLPLTSGDAKGVLTALIGAAGAGLSIASGGEFGMLAGARMVSSNIAKGMLHVSHSGNLSANSGIMGQKKPYLIINRERAYTANSYNKMYGFPANKMIYPGNHSGFVRIKSGRLKTFATEAEKNEIMELLEKGVIM